MAFGTPKTYLFLSLVGLSTLVACSKSPEQYVKDAPVKVTDAERINIGDLYAEPAGKTFSYRSKVNVAERDRRAAENSLKEIKYNEGAAGITFATSFEEALNTLSEVLGVGSDGVGHYYKSGAYIFWRKQAPRTATGFWLDKNYRGVFKVGGEIGDIHIGDDLTKHFTSSDQDGSEFITKLFNALEKKDSSYSCLDQKTCSIKAFPDYYLFSWDKFGMLVSRDMKKLADIRLWLRPAAGILDNSFDIVTNEIINNNEVKLILGDTYGNVSNNLDKSEIDTQSTYFTHNYGKAILVTSKTTSIEREYINPSEDEQVIGLAYVSGYNQDLLLKGQKVIAKLSNDKYVFSLLNDATPVEKNDILLNLAIDVEKNRENYFIGLSDFLAAKISEEFPNHRILQRVNGLHGLNFEQKFGAAITHFDPTSGEGSIFTYQMARNTGKIGYIEKMIFSEEIDKFVLPNFETNITIPVEKLDSLYGFKIGHKLKLSEIDNGRGEATVEILDKDGKTLATARGSYDDKALLDGVYGNDGKVIIETVYSVSVSLLGITLKLKQDGELFVIAGIESKSYNHVIKNICGSGVDLTMNSKKSEVKNLIASKILTEQNKKECLVFRAVRNGAKGGKFESIYFPKHNISLNFFENELQNMSIYSKQEESK